MYPPCEYALSVHSLPLFFLPLPPAPHIIQQISVHIIIIISCTWMDIIYFNTVNSLWCIILKIFCTAKVIITRLKRLPTE
jgi:hypothetical protein